MVRAVFPCSAGLCEIGRMGADMACGAFQIKFAVFVVCGEYDVFGQTARTDFCAVLE